MIRFPSHVAINVGGRALIHHATAQAAQAADVAQDDDADRRARLYRLANQPCAIAELRAFRRAELLALLQAPNPTDWT